MSSRACFSPPNRSEEFEIFKRGNGAEMNKILTENKGFYYVIFFSYL